MIIYMNKKRLAKIKQVVENRQSGLVVVLEDVHDPHNAAAILRSCDAFGVQEVYFCFNKVEPYNPRKVGKVSSSSANKWLDFEIFDSVEKCLKKLKKDGYFVVATVLAEDSKNIFKTKFNQEKLAVLVGTEHSGLSEKAIELADQKVIIPMVGMVQSFNVSVSAALCLFEITRQRFKSKKDFSLSRKDQLKLIKDFKGR